MKLRNAEKRLLIAVSQIIENEGFSKIGVNKIAKQAKCDKVLIYRYFGGLEGLLAAWAKDNDFYTLAYQAYSERNGFKLQEELEKKLGKESKDVRMFITILIASINYIVLATRQYRIFNGIDFSNPEAWELCKQTIYKYIRALFENILK